MTSFKEFFKEFTKDEDVWNMSLEQYNDLKALARKIYEQVKRSEEESR